MPFRAGLVLAGVIVLARGSGAQEHRPSRVEVDAVSGYTFVNAQTWSGFSSINGSSKTSFGVLARLLFLNFSGAQLGVEVGMQQLFSYKVQQTSGSQVVIRTFNVDGFHFAPMLRVADGGRASLDAGVGFHFLGDETVPGIIVNGSYVPYQGRKFSIPVGARVNLVMNDPAPAANFALKAGVSVPLGR